MSVALKMRILLIGFFVIVCFLGYDLYQGYSARQNAKNNHKQEKLSYQNNQYNKA